MDFSKLVERAKAMLVSPKTTWPFVATEPATVKSLYLGYIMVLAAIPAVFTFIENSLIGRTFLGVHVRIGIGAGIGGMVLQWVLALIGVYVVALIINALANTFGGVPNQVQALKAIAYAETAAWVAGFAVIIPWIGWIIMLAGAIYTIYLLYLGLPHTMQCPRGKAAGYTAAAIITAIIVYIIIALIVGTITGFHPGSHVDVGMTVGAATALA